MYVVTSDQMRTIDELTISRKVPGLVLMERAGQGVADIIEECACRTDDLTVSIFLGRGNNAGDGLVVARLLAERGAAVALHYLHEDGAFSPDAFKNYTKLQKIKGDNEIREFYLYRPDWKRKVLEELNKCDLIVDALLGTGISSPVRENYARVIELINGIDLPVLSIDMPSGVNGTTAEVLGAAVRADLTVTMALPKYGCLFYPGKTHTGGLRVVDIGVPGQILQEAGLNVSLVDFEGALDDLPRRSPTAHKFACGALLVIAGSRDYSGAAYLTSVSALRSGCGIVYLAGPESIRPVVQSMAPEIVFIALPETKAGSISKSALEILSGNIRYDAVSIGPGLTTEEETAGFVREFIRSCQAPILIDADALNAFEGEYAELAGISAGRDMVLTPHAGELKRLTGMNLSQIPLNRLDELSSLVEDTNIVLVHKGAPTVIATPGGIRYVNVHGHPGQATAGSGDVLSGAIGGFLAQGCDAAAAARLGVYLQSRAAEIAAGELGERGMIAGDCADVLPLAMYELEKGFKFEV